MHRTHRWLLYTLALTGFALDQGSKYSVFRWLESAPDYRRAVLPGLFDLVAQRKFDSSGNMVLHVNQGALFGLVGPRKK